VRHAALQLHVMQPLPLQLPGVLHLLLLSRAVRALLLLLVQVGLLTGCLCLEQPHMPHLLLLLLLWSGLGVCQRPPVAACRGPQQCCCWAVLHQQQLLLRGSHLHAAPPQQHLLPLLPLPLLQAVLEMALAQPKPS
jgi:hypothetical protein